VLLENLWVPNGVKVGVGLSLLGSETFLVVVSQQLVQEVNRFVADKTLVLGGDEGVPRLLLETAQDVVVLSVKLDIVFVR